MDIGSGKKYPERALSNFAPHEFTIDGVKCGSMEGFLQSLKFSKLNMQNYVCSLIGLKAKYKGKRKKWWREQKLYWQGKTYDRHGEAYQNLLNRAFEQLAKNESFKKALFATRAAVLTHSLGKNDEHKTVLTERELCSRLSKCRLAIRLKII